MSQDSDNILKKIKPGKILIPIIIGLGVVGYMLYTEFDPKAFDLLNFTLQSVFWILLAFVMMIFRDLGYMIRLRVLSDNDLTWRKSFNVVMLWEFTSAITPSAVGGTSVALYFIHKEGLTVGRSTALVLATSFLDELYFLIMFPILLVLVGATDLFTIGKDLIDVDALSFSNRYFYFAVIGYLIKFGFTLLVFYGLFVNPRGFKWLLLKIFKLPILRKWRNGANKTGSDLIIASKELKRKPFKFWLKAFGATFFSWTSRYWVVNFMLLAFFAVNEHFIIFARQLVMWIMMLVMPTPGGSGFAEIVFKDYLGEFVTPIGLAVSMALLWRLISYYPYLIIGAVAVPRWVKKVSSSNN